MDPGVRTFQTIYDADGKMIKWGRGNMSKLFRILGGVDDINRKLHESKQDHGVKVRRGRRKMRKARLRQFERARNLVKEVHCKLAKWLCENYRVILLPDFKTSQNGVSKR